MLTPTERPIVFVTHLPSTYKVNLYARISKTIPNITIIFAGLGSAIRAKEFVNNSLCCQSILLSKHQFEYRNIFTSLAKVSYSIIRINPKVLVINGWDLPEFLVALLYAIIAKRKIILQVEGSDPYPTFTPSIATLFRRAARTYKKFFLNHCTTIFFSSPRGLHYYSDMCNALLHHRVVVNGVGITNIEDSLTLCKEFKAKDTSSLFIGISRYSDEKNLEFVASAFGGLPDLYYSHYGNGLEMSSLPFKMRGISNVKFNGPISNNHIPQLLASSCCLILMSTYEAWGLVAEEANLCGIPCIVSSTSGYGSWSQQAGVNLVIDPTEQTALIDAIRIIASGHHNLPTGNDLRDLVLKKNQAQVNHYLSFLAS